MGGTKQLVRLVVENAGSNAETGISATRNQPRHRKLSGGVLDVDVRLNNDIGRDLRRGRGGQRGTLDENM
jgi:hypothetical protein